MLDLRCLHGYHAAWPLSTEKVADCLGALHARQRTFRLAVTMFRLPMSSNMCSAVALARLKIEVAEAQRICRRWQIRMSCSQVGCWFMRVCSDLSHSHVGRRLLHIGRIFVCGFINAAYGFWALAGGLLLGSLQSHSRRTRGFSDFNAKVFIMFEIQLIRKAQSSFVALPA